ncbi:hypothetical protein ACHWQZ_G012386 [Mnemiopsis leidyi]
MAHFFKLCTFCLVALQSVDSCKNLEHILDISDSCQMILQYTSDQQNQCLAPKVDRWQESLTAHNETFPSYDKTIIVWAKKAESFLDVTKRLRKRDLKVEPKPRRDVLFIEIRNMRSILTNLKDKLTETLVDVIEFENPQDFLSAVYSLDYWTSILLFKEIPCQ